MKITLISPYTNISAIGLRSISSYLKASGFETRVILLPIHKTFMDPNQKRYRDNTLDQLVDLCRGSEIVGLSLMTDFRSHAIEITQRLRLSLDAYIVWGGVHPTIAPLECVDYADAVCVGEGEDAMLELAFNIKNKKDIYGIENWWFKRGDRLIKNAVRPLIQDLDALPFTDYDMTDEFVLDGGDIKKMDDELFEKYVTRIKVPSFDDPVPAIQVMGSRGCPHSCTYCANNMYRKIYPKQRWLRKQSPDRIIAELKAIKVRFPFFTSVIISDDSFLTRKEEDIVTFSQLYADKIQLPFRCLGSPLNINKTKLEALTQAGLFGLQIGIQSGSPKTLGLYKRKIAGEKILEVSELFSKTKGLLPIYDVITDNPYESYEDCLQTLQLLLKLKRPYKLNIFSLTFYPGTELYQMAYNDGTINAHYYNVYSKLNRTYINLILRLFEKMAPRPLLAFMIHPFVMFILNRSFFSVIWRATHHLKSSLYKISRIFVRRTRTVKSEI